MFTGLVEEVDRVIYLRRHSRGGKLRLESGTGFETGESVAVNGVCQTVSSLERDGFSCDILPETLRVTNLGSLKSGDKVNVERALQAGGRIGGHLMSGHIDGTGLVRKIDRSGGMIEIEIEKNLHSYLVPKCSIAVDGISLTVGPRLEGKSFQVYIIPHTWKSTSLESIRPGSRVNIEIDMLAKYVKQFTSSGRD
ncbi:MAG: riboflavin synthase [Candidatus Krumholzibacteriales bacterium]